MDDAFELPVRYRNQDLNYPGYFKRRGYSYRIEMQIDGFVIYFEPDEERNWRAIMDTSPNNHSPIPGDKIQAIIEALNQYLG